MPFDGCLYRRAEMRQVDKIPPIVRAYEGDGCQGRRIDDRHGRPAVEEGREVAVDLLQINIRAPRLGEHGAELRIDHRAKNGNDASYDPDRNEQYRRAKLAGHGRRLHEDARSNDTAHDDGDGGPEADVLFKIHYSCVGRKPVWGSYSGDICFLGLTLTHEFGHDTVK